MASRIALPENRCLFVYSLVSGDQPLKTWTEILYVSQLIDEHLGFLLLL